MSPKATLCLCCLLLLLVFCPVISFTAGTKGGSSYDLQQIQPLRMAEGWNYVNCGSPSDAVEVKSIRVFPDPPQRGKDVTISFDIDVHRIIEKGSIAYVIVWLGDDIFFRKAYDVCEDLECPVEPGTHQVEHTFPLAGKTPRAKFSLNVRGYTKNDGDLLCLDAEADLTVRRPF